MTSPIEKKPKRPAKGGNKGLTKETNPSLSQRLPREKGCIIAPVGDGMTPFERALMILGPRVQVTKVYYMLDGKPCNATDLMKAAGIVV